MIDLLSRTDRQDDGVYRVRLISLTGSRKVADHHALVLAVSHYVIERVLIVVLKKDLEGFVVRDLAAQHGEDCLSDEHERRAEDRALVEACADSKSDDTAGPKAGRRSQALDLFIVDDDDRSSADETETGDDLGTESGDIRRKIHVQVEIDTRHRCDTCTDTYQDMGSKSRRTVLVGSLHSDSQTQEHRHKQADQGAQHRDISYAVKTTQHAVPPSRNQFVQ